MAGYTFDDFPSIEENFVQKGYQWVGTKFLTKFAFIDGQFKVVPNGTREEAHQAKREEVISLLSEADKKKYDVSLISVLMVGNQNQQRLAFFAKATPK